MKKTIGIVGVVAFCLTVMSSNAQTPETNTQPAVTPVQQTWDHKKNPTVTAITSKYEGKYLTARPASTEADIFPVIGKYESSTNTDAPAVSIALDAVNKGIVWIDGLPQGRVKAILKRSPATYKIPAQKTEDGKEIAEGTLIFDKDANTVSISIGKAFNDVDPALAFTAPAEEEPAPATTKTSKSKKSKTVQQPKPWTYTGTKLVVETAATN